VAKVILVGCFAKRVLDGGFGVLDLRSEIRDSIVIVLVSTGVIIGTGSPVRRRILIRAARERGFFVLPHKTGSCKLPE